MLVAKFKQTFALLAFSHLNPTMAATKEVLSQKVAKPQNLYGRCRGWVGTCGGARGVAGGRLVSAVLVVSGDSPCFSRLVMSKCKTRVSIAWSCHAIQSVEHDPCHFEYYLESWHTFRKFVVFFI